METLLVTGATGLIGRNVVETFAQSFHVIGIGRSDSNFSGKSALENVDYVKMDFLDENQVESVCRKTKPKIIIHCAGIAHQGIINALPDKAYDKVNHRAAVKLAEIAGKVNPDLYFIFLSSVSVYGEKYGRDVDESASCFPTSAYGKSKLAAEYGLMNLFKKGRIRKLDILRLAPVYSYDWKLNLEKRVCGPQGRFFLKFGNGSQKISILSIRNLMDFISFRISKKKSNQTCNVINITDTEACSFKELIGTLNSGNRGCKKPAIPVPLTFVNWGIWAAGWVFRRRKEWINSCYHKLSRDMVFDNQRMHSMGFKPEHSIASIFNTKK